MIDKVLYFIKDFFPDFLGSLGEMLLKIIIIITVMLVVLEVLKVLKVLDFINKYLFFFTKHLGISKSASMPLLIGVFTGITYGAGAILASYANKEMNKKDVILVSVFLCMCHALIEDTILFATQGANGWILIIARIVLAIIVTVIFNLILSKRQSMKE